MFLRKIGILLLRGTLEAAFTWGACPVRPLTRDW